MLKLFKQIRSIIVGFYTLWFKPKPVYFEERYKECEKCEFNSHGTKKVLNFIPIKQEQCLACGCFIKAKVSSPEEECPLAKWKAHEEAKIKSN